MDSCVRSIVLQLNVIGKVELQKAHSQGKVIQGLHESDNMAPIVKKNWHTGIQQSLALNHTEYSLLSNPQVRSFYLQLNVIVKLSYRSLLLVLKEISIDMCWLAWPQYVFVHTR